jgi:hypothetical protein
MTLPWDLPLQLGNPSIDQPWIYIILLAVGGILFLIQFKYMFFPTWKGKILEFQDFSENACNSCKGNPKGRTSIEIKVKTDDGEIIDAEVSYCSVCMNKLNVGSRVGVSQIGSRRVAQSLVRFSRGSTW